MSRNYVFDGMDSFDALERKLSLSAVSVGHQHIDEDDLPPPDPEPDPGPPPDTEGPDAYPTLPDTGPAGPG
jgi:hypothetical protein